MMNDEQHTGAPVNDGHAAWESVAFVQQILGRHFVYAVL
jgi:hypothetical protein